MGAVEVLARVRSNSIGTHDLARFLLSVPDVPVDLREQPGDRESWTGPFSGGGLGEWFQVGVLANGREPGVGVRSS